MLLLLQLPNFEAEMKGAGVDQLFLTSGARASSAMGVSGVSIDIGAIIVHS